jgi:LCP family protein required for cell wall assembly
VSDRFLQPESSSAGDERRVFIPAPPSAPSRARTGGSGGVSARPGRVAAPAPDRSAGRVIDRRRGGGRGEPPWPPDGGDEGRPGGGFGGRLRRVRWRRVVLVTAVVLVLALLGSFLYVRSVFNRIDRVEVSGSLTSASSGTNYLIVGSDSRENVTEEGDAGFNGTEDQVRGSRADTMMLLHLEGGSAQMLSIPRDLYVTLACTGGGEKINAAYNTNLDGGGPECLVDTITESLGIPIDRYMEVDFVSFAGLVDSLGGITIDFEHPAQDTNSGLSVTQTGPVQLNGEQALAYVRSRYYQELIDGEWVQDPTGDLGRGERQRAFLTQVIGKLSDTRNPFSLASAAGDMSTGLRIDDEMTLFDAIRLGWGMRGKTPETLDIREALSNDRNDAGAVLILDEEIADPILDEIR